MTTLSPKAGKKTVQELQETFLEQLLQTQTPVSCFLINGVRLSGVIKAMDRYTIIISSTKGSSGPQLIYKAAISTICPSVPEMAIPKR